MHDYEIYDKLQKKKDRGEAMTGHEVMQLKLITEIIILKDQLKEATKALEIIAGYSPVKPMDVFFTSNHEIAKKALNYIKELK
jgi:hypothetical protein